MRRCARWFPVASLYIGLTPEEKYLGVGSERILPVVDVACISSVAWRFAGPVAAEKAEATPELEIEAYLGPVHDSRLCLNNILTSLRLYLRFPSCQRVLPEASSYRHIQGLQQSLVICCNATMSPISKFRVRRMAWKGARRFRNSRPPRKQPL
jgi:hypothetical protein